MTEIEGLTPMLQVESVTSTIDFYVHKLGFTCTAADHDDRGEPNFAVLTRAGVAIMFNRFHGGAHTRGATHPVMTGSLYFYVDDVNALAAELSRREAPVVSGPRETPHGMVELRILDSSGYLLIFGSRQERP